MFKFICYLSNGMVLCRILSLVYKEVATSWLIWIIYDKYGLDLHLFAGGNLPGILWFAATRFPLVDVKCMWHFIYGTLVVRVIFIAFDYYTQCIDSVFACYHHFASSMREEQKICVLSQKMDMKLTSQLGNFPYVIALGKFCVYRVKGFFCKKRLCHVYTKRSRRKATTILCIIF